MNATRSLVSLLLLMLLFTGMRALMFVLLPAIALDSALPSTLAGLAAVLMNVGFAAALWTVERIPGDRRLRIGLTLAGALGSTLLLTAVRAHWLLLVVITVQSYALGGYFANGVPWMAAISPPEKRGGYMGAHELMAMVAYTVGPLFAGATLPVLGWRGVALSWIGLLTVVGLALLTIVAQSPPAAAAARRAADAAPLRLDLRFAAHAAMGACFTTLMSGFLNLLPIWVVGRWGIPAATTASLIGLARMAGLLGSPASGLLSDRVDRLKLISWYALLAAGTVFGMTRVGYGATFVVLLTLLCLVTSAMSPVYYAAVSEAYPVDRRPGELGRVVAVGNSTGQVVIPVLMSLTMGSYGYAFSYIAMAVCLITAAGVIWLQRQSAA